MKVVTDFCLAFAAHDPDRIMSFFADPCSYRVLETRDPIKGFAAVRDQIRTLEKTSNASKSWTRSRADRWSSMNGSTTSNRAGQFHCGHGTGWACSF